MPSDHGFGLDQGQRFSSVGPDYRSYNPKNSVTSLQLAFLRLPFEDVELMAKREVLKDQRAVGPQDRDEGAKKDEYHRSDDIIKPS